MSLDLLDNRNIVQWFIYGFVVLATIEAGLYELAQFFEWDSVITRIDYTLTVLPWIGGFTAIAGIWFIAAVLEEILIELRDK